MPILETEGQVLFESQAICEYLEESFPSPELMPRDLTERARTRAWFAFSGEDLFGPQFRFMWTSDKEVQDKALDGLRVATARLETEMSGRSWLDSDGTTFGMADVAVAPFFTRYALVKDKWGVDLLADRPNVTAWAERTLSKTTVQESVPEDFVQACEAGMKQAGSLLLG